MSGLKELSPTMLAYFAQVDYQTHLALIAAVFVDGAEMQIGDALHCRP
jgi:hypothetical protein